MANARANGKDILNEKNNSSSLYYTTVYSMMMTGAAHANGFGHRYREQFGSGGISRIDGLDFSLTKTKIFHKNR